MSIFVVLSNYFDNGFFGSYSTLKRARKAIEHFLGDNSDINSFVDLGNYNYQFTTIRGETFGAEIYWDYLDNEFEEHLLSD